MRAQHLQSVAVSPRPELPAEAKLLYQRIADISRLLASLNAAVEDLEGIETPALDESFDFYDEVERFEISLIKRALRITAGSQVRAARLLKLNTTTLNTKIKHFKLLDKPSSADVVDDFND
ncbi:MAG TPA: helix-turn-helix domain-containing protein [Pyrinomonadaceae bacterium]|nr:helix-turn-helix domain-containing protein [Pyrinomonadaceae bacterium]